MAYTMFTNDSSQGGLDLACTLVVPALSQIAAGGVEEAEEGDVVEKEVKVVEKVREEWCQCLNRPQLSESQFIYHSVNEDCDYIHTHTCMHVYKHMYT